MFCFVPMLHTLASFSTDLLISMKRNVLSIHIHVIWNVAELVPTDHP